MRPRINQQQTTFTPWSWWTTQSALTAHNRNIVGSLNALVKMDKVCVSLLTVDEPSLAAQDARMGIPS